MSGAGPPTWPENGSHAPPPAVVIIAWAPSQTSVQRDAESMRHWPALQLWQPPQGAHAAPMVPHCCVVRLRTQAVPLQHPSAQLSGVQLGPPAAPPRPVLPATLPAAPATPPPAPARLPPSPPRLPAAPAPPPALPASPPSAPPGEPAAPATPEFPATPDEPAAPDEPASPVEPPSS